MVANLLSKCSRLDMAKKLIFFHLIMTPLPDLTESVQSSTYLLARCDAHPPQIMTTDWELRERPAVEIVQQLLFTSRFQQLTHLGLCVQIPILKKKEDTVSISLSYQKHYKCFLFSILTSLFFSSADCSYRFDGWSRNLRQWQSQCRVWCCRGYLDPWGASACIWPKNEPRSSPLLTTSVWGPLSARHLGSGEGLPRLSWVGEIGLGYSATLASLPQRCHLVVDLKRSRDRKNNLNSS